MICRFARVGWFLPSLLIPVLLSCCSDAEQYALDEDGPREHPDTIIEEYTELADVLVPAREYLRERTQEVLATAAPPIAGEAEFEGKVMVFGAVAKPVITPLTPSMRLTRAIGAAGGLRRDANAHCVFVLRRCRTFAESRAIVVEYTAITRYGDLSQDLPLRPKDVIYVPPSTVQRRLYMSPMLHYLQCDYTLRRLIGILEKIR